MVQYLISVYQPDGEPPPPEVLAPIMARVQDWEGQLKSAGAWVFTGGMMPASAATVVRVTDAETVITDGPFAEGKEHLGGFTVITAPDLDAALEWGRGLASITGLPIEVRPMFSGEPA
jgi:hypothetical protein